MSPVGARLLPRAGTPGGQNHFVHYAFYAHQRRVLTPMVAVFPDAAPPAVDVGANSLPFGGTTFAAGGNSGRSGGTAASRRAHRRAGPRRDRKGGQVRAGPHPRSPCLRTGASQRPTLGANTSRKVLAVVRGAHFVDQRTGLPADVPAAVRAPRPSGRVVGSGFVTPWGQRGSLLVVEIRGGTATTSSVARPRATPAREGR